MQPDGGIKWNVKADEIHTDHIEMSGKKISAIIYYGKDSAGGLLLKQKLVFPMLRIIPNNTRGSLIRTFDQHIMDSVMVNGTYVQEIPQSFYIKGYLQSESSTNTSLFIKRQIFPSTEKAVYIERYTLSNTGKKPLSVSIPMQDKNMVTAAETGVDGAYTLNYRVYNGGSVVLQPAEKYTFAVVISAEKNFIAADYEFEKRKAMVEELGESLILETPNDTINRMFSFAKIRAAESIFDTKQGLMHAPGGGDYYAAIWANDQAEYVNPFFPFLGNAAGNESARNSFRLFARYMNDDYKPIPSSIIAEGTDFWNGAGDRGDQAMIAYGASLFALYSADTINAKRLWPLISWCNEYLRRHKTKEGVITSDSDELEGRFKAGRINLSTNVLAYGAFVYASRLAASLGLQQDANRLRQDALQLRKDIETYFGATVEGYKTYRYYEGNEVLRSWICIPLVMDIFDRKEGTVKALLSPRLWTKNGILTEAGSATFWDRSTLYAFRGMLRAGIADTTLPYLKYYSSQRLLGNHVPYAIEAWPEGDQRHLSAESGLYCRVITEGLFGFDPLSFSQFTICPRLPKEWSSMKLRNIRAFNRNFDIEVSRHKINVMSGGKMIKSINWDGRSPVNLTF
jgi:Glucoamylase and related glycosyl hydrolases